MALARCLDHTPTQRHYRNFAYPQQGLTCEVEACRQPAVIWLDPEEVREYDWGTRTFWETRTLTTMKAGNLGVRGMPWRLPTALSQFLRWPQPSLRFQPRFMRLSRKPRP